MFQNIADDLFLRLEDLCPEGFNFGFHYKYSRPACTRITYRDDWMDTYSKFNFIVGDPAVIWGMANIGACRWSSVRSEDLLGVLRSANEHGYHYGLALGYGPQGCRSIGSCARGDREFTSDEMAEIFEIFSQIHELMTRTWQLKPHQKAALELFARDLTYADICDRLRIGRTALKNRLNGAKTALGAETNAEAVRLALERGIICGGGYGGVASGLPRPN